MTIGELTARGRISKGILAAAVQRLLLDPPDGLVTQSTTLGDLSEWRTVRVADIGPEPVGSRDLEDILHRMETRNARLRPIRDTDVPQLYAAAIDPRWSHRWRYRGATPSAQEFVGQLSQGVLAQFIVERTTDRAQIGLVTAYNARADLGWAYVAFARTSAPDAQTTSEMLEGGFLFISFLFRNWPFRKLYAEVPGWNWDRFEDGSGDFFTLEGRLVEHEWFDGRCWDQYIVALHRTTWNEYQPKLTELYTA